MRKMPQYVNNEKIGIVGLGKLGLPMLSAFISRGFDAYGYDKNPDLITVLRKGEIPYAEPGLKEITVLDNLWQSRFFNTIEDLVRTVDVVFMIVPTPTVDEEFETKYLVSAIDSLSRAAAEIIKNIVCVITSTVNPGDTEKIAALAGDLSGGRVSIVYSPEFIALGSVLEDMLHPDLVLLGGSNSDSVDKIFSIYSRLYKTYPEFHRLSYFEAETAKIAINTFVTTKISFANTIGMFVEKSSGSRESGQRVLNAVGGDSRIGRKYFKYGVSYGGPCFPRDNRALASHLAKSGVCNDLPIATDKVNESLVEYWRCKIADQKYDAVVLGGVAYKQGTDFLEESFMLKLARKLKGLEEISTYYYDDIALEVQDIQKICKLSQDRVLAGYKKVLVLHNHGVVQVDHSAENIHLINVWS